MLWTERVLPLLVTVSAYAAYFKVAGRWEEALKGRIAPERARDITLLVGRIALGLVKLAAMLTGIVCSTGLVVVVLFIGMPLSKALIFALIGCVAFAMQSVIDRLTEGDAGYEEEDELARLIASLPPTEDAL